MSVRYYRQLLTQTARIEAFRRALHAVVRPGDAVLEIGAGLGTFSFFAADAGAKSVFAVDGDPIINVAKVIGRLNGYDDRVTFLRGWVPQVQLPEPCNVLVFEDFPARLVDPRSFRVFREAHRRYAVPEVRSVPRRATIYMAPVCSPLVRADAVDIDSDGKEHRYGVDFGASREYVANQPFVSSLTRDDLAADPRCIGEFWFDREPDAGGLSGRATWTIEREGPIDGLAYWFDLELAPGEWLSNAPGAEPGSWGNIFLPVDRALSVAGGDTLEGWVGRDRAEDGAPTWLSWSLEAKGGRGRGHEFAAAPAGFEDMLPFVPEATPVLTQAAEVERLVLQLTDGSRTIRDIVEAIRLEWPDLDPAAAEDMVGRVLKDRVRSAPDVSPARSER